MDSIKGLLDAMTDGKYIYYSAALNRIGAGDLAMGKININQLEESLGLTPDLLSMKAYYYLLNGEKEKAKFYLWLMNITSIQETVRLKYYFISAYYYESIGDIDKTKAYYYKIAESNPVEVLSKELIDAKNRLGLNFAPYYKMCDDLKERQNRRSLELNEAAPIVH